MKQTGDEGSLESCQVHVPSASALICLSLSLSEMSADVSSTHFSPTIDSPIFLCSFYFISSDSFITSCHVWPLPSTPPSSIHPQPFPGHCPPLSISNLPSPGPAVTSTLSSAHTHTHLNTPPITLSGLAFPDVNQSCLQQPLPFHLQHTLTFPDTGESRMQRNHTLLLQLLLLATSPLRCLHLPLSVFIHQPVPDSPSSSLPSFLLHHCILLPSFPLNPSLPDVAITQPHLNPCISCWEKKTQDNQSTSDTRSPADVGCVPLGPAFTVLVKT